MKLEGLAGRRVVLLGLGADVRAALPAIVAAGPAEVLAVERGPMPSELAGDTALEAVSSAEAASRAEVFVRSPGFPRSAPELVAALGRGAAMTTPVDLWLGSVGPTRRVAAVTGTKGKSTVTHLVSRLANEAGVRLGVAGNLGPPVFGTDWDHEAPLVVLEVSSYQAADFHHRPDVAVLTFLAEDHLSWHGGRDRYVADKLRVVRNESGTAGRILVGEHGGAAVGALRDLDPPPTFEVIAAPEAPATVPPHRLRNAALAAAVLEELSGVTVTPSQVVAAARSGMPGRLDRCEGPDDLFCLDDALASNPSAVAAALGWLREIGRSAVVLLGGDDRGVDVAPLRDEVRRWSPEALVAVTLPGSADLARRCEITVVAEASGVAEATERAVVAARRLPGRGAAFGEDVRPVVILSPGAPTPSGTGNWETRSTAFRSTLAALA